LAVLNVELAVMRLVTVLVMLGLAGCASSSTPPTFSGERTVDTTTAPTEQEGYTASLGAADWLLLSKEDDRLEVLATGGGCSRFNGYRVRQTPQEVRLEVVNTVHTSKGLPFACTSELRFTKHMIELPEPLGGAKVSGGCAADPVDGEDKICKNLRSVAGRFR
jgi:hypothetical protein